MAGQDNQIEIGPAVARAHRAQMYRRQTDDPVHRMLWIYSLDPAESRLSGARVKVPVPYEPLDPGPTGSLFKVVGYDSDSQTTLPPVDLEDRRIAIASGIEPSPTDYRFQMQMVYAVAMRTYDTFRRALGRELHWAFDHPKEEPSRLELYPFWNCRQNASYSREAKAIHFGWFRAKEAFGRNLKGGKVFTSLSHDVVVHELTHAFLDGLRGHFLVPYHHDTFAFHEAFADLVAIFTHFSNRAVVKKQIAMARGEISKAKLLFDLARQFGHTTRNDAEALRSALELTDDDNVITYDPKMEIHKLGAVLVAAVFEAFTIVFTRKTRTLLKLATGGTGELPKGDIPDLLCDMLAKAASDLAKQFLTICIRAIDYCPPVAMTFGDYLRAMITADFDIVPDDPWGYREALVDAFIKRRIAIEGVDTLSEKSLLWQPTMGDLNSTNELGPEPDTFGSKVDHADRKYEARAQRVVSYLSKIEIPRTLGFTRPSDCELAGEPGPIVVESARVSRAASPDGALSQHLVAEVSQTIPVKRNNLTFDCTQGSTIIIDSNGRVRYVVTKNVDHIVKAMNSFQGNFESAWVTENGRMKAVDSAFCVWHGKK
ncbi:MAG: hypothetical protein KDB27_34700 [Planctomycetales bacterium]|nr:hypothetical protein [Planctomycetales bacterium]